MTDQSIFITLIEARWVAEKKVLKVNAVSTVLKSQDLWSVATALVYDSNNVLIRSLRDSSRRSHVNYGSLASMT